MKLLKVFLTNVIPVFFFTLLVFALRWFINDWNTGIITAIYQLKTPLDGTNPGLIVEFCKKCMPVPAVVAVGTGILCYLARIKLSIKRCIVIIILVLDAAIIMYDLKILESDRYLINLAQNGDLIEKNITIVEPDKIAGGSKNLILIYAESMEVTYSSRELGGGKPENLIPNLTNIMQREITFSDGELLGGGKSMPGTDWTMGGLFSTMTGLPLKLDLNAPQVNLNDSFCPGVVAIGDVLLNSGYHNYFQCGSDATFGGRRAFFSQHGDYDILDYNYAIEKGYIDEDYHVFWGYEDRKLFEIAKKELVNIGEAYINDNQRFNYTMLTVDTHHPKGYRCELCERTHSDEFADIISCSDRQISEFVEWIEAQPWGKDTTVIVLGDHPSMVAGFWEDTMGYENKPVNVFVNSKFNKNEREMAENPDDSDYIEIDKTKNRIFTHFDLTPTILEAIGFELPEHKMGLGISLFSGKETLAEQVGAETLKKELCKTSHYYNDYILE